jgi:hypothetical protein
MTDVGTCRPVPSPKPKGHSLSTLKCGAARNNATVGDLQTVELAVITATPKTYHCTLNSMESSNYIST